MLRLSAGRVPERAIIVSGKDTLERGGTSRGLQEVV